MVSTAAPTSPGSWGAQLRLQQGGARGCPTGGPHAPSPHQDPLVLDRCASPGIGLPAGELLRGTGKKPMFRLEPTTGTTSARLEGGEQRGADGSPHGHQGPWGCPWCQEPLPTTVVSGQLWEGWARGGHVSPWVPRAPGRFRQVSGATGKAQGTGRGGEEGL